MEITKEEFDILDNETLSHSPSISEPWVKKNQEIINRLIKKGLITREQDDEFWGEDYFQITSAGRMERNIFDKRSAK